MGCLSLIVAAVQVMAARNYKRLIAYACVSSSGVIAIGLSVGKAAAYGVLLYVVSNAVREGAAVPHRRPAARGLRHQRESRR